MSSRGRPQLASKAGTIAVPPLDPAVRNNFGGVSLQGVTFGESVPLVTLDSLDLPACQLLKVDVEGMEVEVLKGAEQLIDDAPADHVSRERPDRTLGGTARQWSTRLEYDAYWHFPRVFNPDNFFGDAENIFGDVASVNILCVPKETKMPVNGLRSGTVGPGNMADAAVTTSDRRGSSVEPARPAQSARQRRHCSMSST